MARASNVARCPSSFLTAFGLGLGGDQDLAAAISSEGCESRCCSW